MVDDTALLIRETFLDIIQKLDRLLCHVDSDIPYDDETISQTKKKLSSLVAYRLTEWRDETFVTERSILKQLQSINTSSLEDLQKIYNIICEKYDIRGKYSQLLDRNVTREQQKEMMRRFSQLWE